MKQRLKGSQRIGRYAHDHVEGCWPVESGLQSTVPDRRVSRDRWRSHKRGLFA